MRDDDTIVAIASASGVGGVGVVRLSGPAALAIGEALVGRALDREVRVAWVRDRGAKVDQVLAFAMRRPASFTGEDVVELQGHGGRENLARLVAAVVARGARLAEPGEFTRRAVANGKLDVQRAEALLEVIHAGSERAWRNAVANLDGKLGARAAVVEARALKVLAEIEGWIDFPDEDLDPRSAGWIDGELEAIGAACEALATGFRHGRAVTAGVVVALVGPVNVGKSSLLNALVGTERALVAAEPGTTRDWLEVATVWDGVAVTLVDTAGLRETADAIERRGIELGEARVASADVVLLVDDGEAPSSDGARYGARAVAVRSKADRGSGADPVTARDAVATSAWTGAGLEALKQRVLTMAGVASREGAEDGVVTTQRQHGVVVGARDAFVAALAAWRAQRPPEVVAEELRTGSALLAALRGTEVGERVLDELFARFCIGK